MFNKDTYDEIKAKVREINKMKKADDRLVAFIDFREVLTMRINNEFEELFSSVNLKRSKEED